VCCCSVHPADHHARALGVVVQVAPLTDAKLQYACSARWHVLGDPDVGAAGEAFEATHRGREGGKGRAGWHCGFGGRSLRSGRGDVGLTLTRDGRGCIRRSMFSRN